MYRFLRIHGLLHELYVNKQSDLTPTSKFESQ